MSNVNVWVYPFPPSALWTWGCIPVYSQQCGRGGVFLSTISSVEVEGVSIFTVSSVWTCRVYPSYRQWYRFALHLGTMFLNAGMPNCMASGHSSTGMHKKLTQLALFINHYPVPAHNHTRIMVIKATEKIRKPTCKIWLRRQERGGLGESPQLQQVDKVEVLEPVGPLTRRLLWIKPLVEELQVGSPLSRVLQEEICRVLVGIVGCQVYGDARMQAYK